MVSLLDDQPVSELAARPDDGAVDARGVLCPPDPEDPTGPGVVAADAGAPLGIEIQRVDMTAWLPPDAKSAFDAVLVASQAADRGLAVARTDAEHRRQEAARQRDQLLAAAEATARELVSNADVNTAGIIALEHEETPETRGSLLLREYRSNVSSIMNRVGSATLVDPQNGTRVVLPGK